MSDGTGAVRYGVPDRLGVFLDGRPGVGGWRALGCVAAAQASASVAAMAAWRKFAFITNYRTTVARCFARRVLSRVCSARRRAGETVPMVTFVRAHFGGCASTGCRFPFCEPARAGGWDLLAFVLVVAFFVYVAQAAHGLTGSARGTAGDTDLAGPSALAGYAARTALRMLIAMLASLVFTFTYATLAAKSRRAEVILVPLLDFLQSVPILGFSITVVFFLQLTPGRVAGAEMAAIFLIFTSQAWNIAFSFYHSLRSIPDELVEVARNFQLSSWMRFWRLEVPFSMPALIWNMMMSMSGGWFFVVASEAISVGNTTVTLPGVGSYIALAIQQKDLAAIGWAIAAMFVVILIFDPVAVASADRERRLVSARSGDRAHPEPLLGAHHECARSRFLGSSPARLPPACAPA